MRKTVNWAAGFGSHGVIVKKSIERAFSAILFAGCATTMVKVGSNGMIKETKVQAVVRNENKVTVYFYSPSRTVEFAIKNEGEWHDFMSNLEKTTGFSVKDGCHILKQRILHSNQNALFEVRRYIE